MINRFIFEVNFGFLVVCVGRVIDDCEVVFRVSRIYVLIDLKGFNRFLNVVVEYGGWDRNNYRIK